MWGTDLWDQYDAVCGHLDSRLEQVKKVSAFVKERVKVEQDYAKELRKLSKSYCKMKAEDTKFLSTECFTKVVAQAEELAQYHETFSTKLQSDVYDAMKRLEKDQVKEKKATMNDASKQQSSYSAALSSAEKIRRKYENAQADSDKALAAYQQADSDMKLSRAAVEKIRKTSETKAAELEDARAAYQTSVEETNRTQQDHFHTHMPEIFNQLQTMDEKRTRELCSHVERYATLEGEILPLMTEAENKVIQQCQSIQAEKDSQFLCDEMRSGQQIPPDLVFEEAMSANHAPKHNHKKASTAGLKEQSTYDLFESLPPAKRRKKLNAKISDLKTATKKEEAELTGLDKLQSVYAANPSLGDASVVQQKIAPLVQRINTMNDELYRYQCALAQMDSKEMPPAPAPASASSGNTLTADSSPVSSSGDAPCVPPPPSGSNNWDDDFQEPAANRCRVVYDFAPTNPGELPVTYGETLEVIQDDGSGWINVRRGTEEGYIPLSYVEMM